MFEDIKLFFKGEEATLQILVTCTTDAEEAGVVFSVVAWFSGSTVNMVNVVGFCFPFPLKMANTA